MTHWPPSLGLFAITVSAMGCLGMGMQRHARHPGLGARIARWHRPVHLGGWLLLALAAQVSVSAQGWGLGLVWLLGAITPAALLAAGLLAYRPRWLVYTTTFCTLTGAVLLALAALNPTPVS